MTDVKTSLSSSVQSRREIHALFLVTGFFIGLATDEEIIPRRFRTYTENKNDVVMVNFCNESLEPFFFFNGSDNCSDNVFRGS